MTPRYKLSGRDFLIWKRLRVIGLWFLAAGLAAAVCVYARTKPAEDIDIVGYSTENGVAYPIHRVDDRNYNLQLRQFGGKANVFAYEVTHWIQTRFQGRRLAYTLAFLSAAGCMACFYVSDLFDLPSPPEDPIDATAAGAPPKIR